MSIFSKKKTKGNVHANAESANLLSSLQNGANLRQIRGLVQHLWLRYSFAVVLIASLSIASYLIVINLNLLNESNSQLVQASTRQLTLMEQAGRLSMRLTWSVSDSERAALRRQLQQIIDELNAQHAALRDGQIKGSQAAAAVDIFSNAPYSLDKRFGHFQNLLTTLVGTAEFAAGNVLLADAEQVSAAIDDINPALHALSKVYEEGSVGKIYRVIEIETYVAFATLLVLLLEIVWIFRPTISRVRQTALFLQQQAAFNQNIITTAQAFVIGLDLNGRVVLFNRYSEEKTGWQYQEVMGVDFAGQFLAQDQRNGFADLKTKLLAERGSDEYEAACLTRTGKILSVRWHFTPVYDPVTKQPLLLLMTGVDLTDLKASANALAVALHEAQTLGERLLEEVAHAAQLQRSLLPSPTIHLPGVAGSAILTTCTEVGGDYYDYYAVDERYAVVIVADASGHGVAAGSLVSSAKIAVQHLAERGETDPARILSFINHALLSATHESMFMTMGCLSLDAATGLLRYASAGHVFPYLRKQRDHAAVWTALESTGVPLGRVADAVYHNIEVEMMPGERLFLYTDGLVEERSIVDGDALGFERLEQMLGEYGAMSCDETAYWLQHALEQHCGSQVLSDDVTLLVLDYTHRCVSKTPWLTMPTTESTLLRISDGAYRLGSMLPEAHISKQHQVFLAESEFSDLLPRFCHDGIRRVLSEDDVAVRTLGLPALLAQHHPSAVEDLYRLIGKCTVQRQFLLSHSDEKPFIQMEVASLLTQQPLLDAEHSETLLVVMDELLENALYGAPRDAANRPLYAKASSRDVAVSEGIRLDLALNEQWLGVMVTDLWGTLTPAVFLQRIALNSQLRGLQEGIGGAGLFLAWQLADYCQIRVLPRQKTQITVLWSRIQKPNPDIASGFQFLYHTEMDELCEIDHSGSTQALSVSAKEPHLEETC